MSNCNKKQEICIGILEEEPDLRSFTCGNNSIDMQIKEAYYCVVLKQFYAYSITYKDEIIGYYMIGIKEIIEDERGVELYGYTFHSIHIMYLAIHEKFQKKGIGTLVLKHIIQEAKLISNKVPIRFITLDALPSKVSWYADRGFKCYDQTQKNTENYKMRMDLIDIDKLEQYEEIQIG